MENPARFTAYKLSFLLIGLSYLFLYLSVPWIQIFSLCVSLVCLLAGIFFPDQFDTIYRKSQSFLFGIFSLLYSILSLSFYLLIWKPISRLFPLGKD
ncbi:hypothetical protein CH373_09945 [Leptospira perolatii]|uniref:Uncharacterized protein n=1 Tax=Leptospira perolatii TaxID=2023191 RepID=A0A2M9ZMN0_9LEPT|nr:hypothetical protein CH360_07690 [Leptospira perolatii]PJZ73287.1 hypothetical protein CH373_09945 [Leptospira perolatii]